MLALTALTFGVPANASGDSPDGVGDRGQAPAPPAGEAAGATRRQAPPPPPLGVRFGESLEGRRFRIAYTFEQERLAGLRTGTDSLSPADLRGLGYREAPRRLESTLHRLTLSWAPHPRTTLVLEVPYVAHEYTRSTLVPATADLQQRQSEGQGLGDIGFAVVIPFIRKGAESSQVHVGFDVPTGSIRRRDEGRPLPYAVQPGNGSVDLEWGWTYKGELPAFAWGGQVVGRHPVGRNGRDWRQGSRFSGRIWGVVRIVAGLSASLRAEWEKQNETEGFDRALQPQSSPAENAALQDGTTLALAPGMSLDIPGLAGQRLALEVGIPVYQDLDGPQLERDWTVRAGWQWTY